MEWVYTEEGFLCHRKASFLVPQAQCGGGRLRKSWRRIIEEETATEGKTLKEAKVIAGNRMCWHCFVEALCSKAEK
jgi:hypothetical protein